MARTEEENMKRSIRLLTSAAAAVALAATAFAITALTAPSAHAQVPIYSPPTTQVVPVQPVPVQPVQPVLIQPGAPTANAGGPYSAQPGVAITLNGGGSVNAVNYVWNLGDGTQATGIAVTKAYAAPGVYTVVLTVSDAFGRVASASTTVTVGGVVPVTTVVAAPVINTVVTPVYSSFNTYNSCTWWNGWTWVNRCATPVVYPIVRPITVTPGLYPYVPHTPYFPPYWCPPGRFCR
jgi:hypothetical protein